MIYKRVNYSACLFNTLGEERERERERFCSSTRGLLPSEGWFCVEFLFLIDNKEKQILGKEEELKKQRRQRKEERTRKKERGRKTTVLIRKEP